MQVAAIIAEFNPFHNGHAHLIAETKKAGARQIVAVMSGCYVQRGEPALFDKWVRAQAALSCGADLVLELPLPYAVSGAERFARGAVFLCEALGAVDTLAFGCEAQALQGLLQARALLDSPELPALIQSQLKENPGIPFAAARACALRQLGGEEAAALLSGPNNALALEYLAALKKCSSAIRPFAVRRMGAEHDAPAAEGRFASATLLRARILKEGRGSALPYVPEQLHTLYREASVLHPAAFETAMLSRLPPRGAAFPAAGAERGAGTPALCGYTRGLHPAGALLPDEIKALYARADAAAGAGSLSGGGGTAYAGAAALSAHFRLYRCRTEAAYKRTGPAAGGRELKKAGKKGGRLRRVCQAGGGSRRSIYALLYPACPLCKGIYSGGAAGIDAHLRQAFMAGPFCGDKFLSSAPQAGTRC